MASFQPVALLMLALLLGAPPPATRPARGFYASPHGSRAGDGSAKHPWDLATALAGGPAKNQVGAGDTIWLRGGTYRGSFRSTVSGEPGAPVVVRQFPGERAIIDGASSTKDTWLVSGAYSVFWGFELTNSNPQRVTASSTAEIRPALIYNYAPHTKYIGLIVHDGGVALYTEAKFADVEIAECVFYNNGWQEPGHGHGHALYVKNYTGPLVVRDNIVFNQYGYGIHAYTNANSGKLSNITIEGNVSFNNGSLEERELSPNILLGGDGYASGDVIRENLTYYSPSLSGTRSNVIIGWKTLQNGDVIVEHNYFVGGGPVLRVGYWSAARVSDNTLIATRGIDALIERRDPAARAQIWRDNIEQLHAPTATKVVVRASRYEPGRANVVVFNWGKQRAVAADIRGVLAPGDRYEVRNVQNLFGTPVATGTVTGTTVSIPMGGVTPPVPVGLTTSRAPQTGPDFDAFIVTRLSS
jgi:hypothetical protein